MSDFNKQYDDWFDSYGGFDSYDSGKAAWNYQQVKIEQLKKKLLVAEANLRWANNQEGSF